MRRGWRVRKGSGRDRQDGYSLSVAAVKVVTLEVSSNIISSWQFQSILVHTPTKATFSAPGWFALEMGLKGTTVRGG